MTRPARSPWPLRVFLLLMAVLGVVELVRDGVTLVSGFYLFGALGVLLAHGLTDTAGSGRGRRVAGSALIAVGAVLMILHFARSL